MLKTRIFLTRRFLLFILTPVPDIAVTGETCAALRAAGTAARKAKSSVIAALSSRKIHFPELFVRISSFSSAASCTRKISGDSSPVGGGENSGCGKQSG